MGSALHIPLPKGLKAGSSVSTKITYKTTAECTALQWLDKEYVINLQIEEPLIKWDIPIVRPKGNNSHIFSVNVNPSMPLHSPLCKVNSSFFKTAFTSSILIFHSSRYFFSQICALVYHTSYYLFADPLLLEIHCIRHLNPSHITFCNMNITSLRRTRPRWQSDRQRSRNLSLQP